MTDLGESALPEPEQPITSESENVKQVDIQQPDVKPLAEQLPADEVDPATRTASETSGTAGGAKAGTEGAADAEEGKTTVTTTPRKPLQVPEGVSGRVTQETLRDYVGPYVITSLFVPG